MLIANVTKHVPYCPKCGEPADPSNSLYSYGIENKKWYFIYRCKCKKKVKYFTDNDFKAKDWRCQDGN